MIQEDMFVLTLDFCVCVCVCGCVCVYLMYVCVAYMRACLLFSVCAFSVCVGGFGVYM